VKTSKHFLRVRSWVVGIAILTPSVAMAADSSFRLETILQSLIELLNSDIARTLFVLSIIGVGYGCLYLGRIPKSRAMGAILGIGIVFSATYIAQQLGVNP